MAAAGWRLAKPGVVEGAFLLRPHGTEGASGSPGLFHRALNEVRARDLVTSEWPHLTSVILGVSVNICTWGTDVQPLGVSMEWEPGDRGDSCSPL